MGRRTKRTDGLLQKSFRINGKKYIVYGHSEDELSEKAVAKKEAVKKGIEKHDNPTVNEYYSRWLVGRKETVSEATIRTQDKFFGIMKAVKIDALGVTFGEIKMQKVTIEDLRALQTALKEKRKTQTVNDYLALLKHIFSDAFKERVIEYNPCVLLKNLKRTEETARDTHHRALSLEEQKVFFGSGRCQNSFYNNVFRLAIHTGLRIGEIGALKYSDIKKDYIQIERTITRTETGAYIIGENAKTKAGKRSIPLNDEIRQIISDQKRINAILDGDTIPFDGTIFKAPERGLLMATPIDREIKTICSAAGIEPFTMHAFRATFATRAIESGMNPKTLQEILGHSNFNLTMSLYGHCLENTKKTEMERVKIVI